MSASDPLMESFVMDAKDVLSRLESHFSALKGALTEPDPESINDIFRGIHNIKGNSSFVGLKNVNVLANYMEEVMGAVREKKLDIDNYTVEALYRALDRLHHMVENIEDSEDVDNRELLAELGRLLILENKASEARPVKEVNPPAPESVASSRPIKKAASAKPIAPPKPSEKIRPATPAPKVTPPLSYSASEDLYTINGSPLNLIKNRNESRVVQAMKEIIPGYPGFDQCRVCTEDVYALAINSLTPEYAQDGSIVFRHQVPYDQVREEVMKALGKVIEKPTHQ